MVIRKGYKQTEVGVIPEDWDCREINSEIKEISMGPFGSDIPVSCFTSEGVPVLNGHSVSKIKLIDTFKNYVSEEKAKSLKKAVAQQGDIIVTHRGTIGQISYIPIGSRYKKYVISQSQFRVRLNQDAVNPHFVVSYFLSPKGQSFLLEKKGHTGVPALAQPTTNFRKLCIPLPSLPEQEQIVNAFEDIDDLILSLEKHISKRKAIKQGAMQELLTGKRRLPGFEGEWKTKKLGEYCSLVTKQTGFDYSAYIKPALITQKMPNTLPMIQTINFRGRKFSFDTDYYIPKTVALQFPNIVLNEKCVLFSIVGASVGNVGLYPGGTTAFCGGAIGITSFHDEQDAEWVYNYMSSPDGQAQIQYVTKGGAQATVTIADIRNFKIPTPEKDERDAISSVLENMDHEIEVLEEKLAKYRQVKQGMMQQLLTGKIRLTKDIEDSVQTEQVTAEKAMPSKPAHNHQFDDAVAIAAIVDAFYSDKYPLGRVKVQKLLYLLHRHQAVSVSDFKRIFAEEGFSIKNTAERLHIQERMAAQLARKLKVRK